MSTRAQAGNPDHDESVTAAKGVLLWRVGSDACLWSPYDSRSRCAVKSRVTGGHCQSARERLPCCRPSHERSRPGRGRVRCRLQPVVPLTAGDDTSHADLAWRQLEDYPILACPQPAQVRTTMDPLQFLHIASPAADELIESGAHPLAGPCVQGRELCLSSFGNEDLPFHGRSWSFFQPFSSPRIAYCSSIKAT